MIDIGETLEDLFDIDWCLTADKSIDEKSVFIWSFWGFFKIFNEGNWIISLLSFTGVNDGFDTLLFFNMDFLSFFNSKVDYLLESWFVISDSKFFKTASGTFDLRPYIKSSIVWGFTSIPIRRSFILRMTLASFSTRSGLYKLV